MKSARFFSIIFVLSACSSIPSPGGPDVSAVAVHATEVAREVFFAKVDGPGGLKSEIIRHHYSPKGFILPKKADAYFYIFNVPPGEYAVVGYTFVRDMGLDTEKKIGYFFPRSLVEATRVKVEPGKLAFIGDVVPTGIAKAPDDVQSFYANATGLSAGPYLFESGAVRRDETQRAMFRGSVKRHLIEEPEWLGRIQQ